MIENTILSSLINDQQFIRKAIAHIDRDYFSDIGDQIAFALIKDHYVKYNKQPSKASLLIDLSEKKINENFYEKAIETLDKLNDDRVDTQWIIDTTENWCKKRAFFNAIRDAAELLDKDDTTIYHGALDKVSKALSVGFDSDLGSNYFESAADRYDRMKQGVSQLALTIEIFNKVTKGGFVNPSLTVFMAPTGVGKSLFLCNIAADFLKQGKNVVYFTMEMSEDQVEQRIDLNLLDMNVDNLKMMEKQQFVNRVVNVKKATCGELIVKEYPSGSAHAGHFRYFLEELKLKKQFTPDVIVIDYLNICSAMKINKSAGLYDYVGTISVEIRGLGQEFGCPVFTATQTNREGTKSVDFDKTDIADSWGVTHNADYIYGIVETEELAKMGQMRIKRLKDRYNDYTSWYTSFIIGVDKTKQRIYDIQQNDEQSSMEEDERINDQFLNLITEE